MQPESAAPPADSSNTRERILDVAESLFAARGFAGTPIRHIASEVGLTPASLYNHFDGKQALYEAVLERGVRPLMEILQTVPAHAGSEDDAARLVGAIMEHLAQRPHLPGLVQQETLTGGLALARLSRAWMAPIIEQGMLSLKTASGSRWLESEYPNVVLAWLNMVFGYFAMAPMIREVFDQEPLSPEALERQSVFLSKLVSLMMSADPAPERPGPEGV
jgi:AcrR family transcriptional regulator